MEYVYDVRSRHYMVQEVKGGLVTCISREHVEDVGSVEKAMSMAKAKAVLHRGEYVIPVKKGGAVCSYCRTTTDSTTTNCRNCGAPK